MPSNDFFYPLNGTPSENANTIGLCLFAIALPISLPAVCTPPYDMLYLPIAQAGLGSGIERVFLNRKSSTFSGDLSMIEDIEKTIAREKDEIRRSFKAEVKGSTDWIRRAIGSPIR